MRFPENRNKRGLIESAGAANDAAVGFPSTATLSAVMNRFRDASRKKVNWPCFMCVCFVRSNSGRSLLAFGKRCWLM